MAVRFRLVVLFVLLIFLKGPAQSLVITHTATVCAGIPFSVTAVSTNTAAFSYSWSASANQSLITTVSNSASLIAPVCGSAVISCSVFNLANNLLSTATITFLVFCPSISVSPAASTLCGTSSLVLTASGASSYTWSTGGNGSSVSVTPVSSTVYTVTSPGSVCPALSTVIVQDVSITSSAASLCPNGISTLSASGTMASYNWFQPPGVFMNGGSAAQVTAQPQSLPATYTVYAFYTSGCIRSSTFSIQPFIYRPQISGSSSVCPGGSLTLTGSGASTYTWTSATLSVSALSFTASQTIASTYSLRADSAGCNGTRTVVVGIYSLPTVQISSTSNTVCNGQSAALFASGAVNYTWTNAPGLLSSLFGGSVNVSPLSTTIYTVQGISAQGCKNSGTLTVYFANYPTVSLFINVSAVCPGYSATAIGQGAVSYFWKGPSLPVTLQANSVGLPAGSYTLIGTNGGGCSDSTSFLISALPALNIQITPAASATCLYEDGTVYPVTLLATGAPSYSWHASPAFSTGTLTGFNVTVTPSVSTCYTVTGYSSSCFGSASVCVVSGQICTALNEERVNASDPIYYDHTHSVIHIQSAKEGILQVRDLSGRLVLEHNLSPGSNIKEVEITALSPGYYSLHYFSGFQKQQFLIIKL